MANEMNENQGDENETLPAAAALGIVTQVREYTRGSREALRKVLASADLAPETRAELQAAFDALRGATNLARSARNRMREAFEAAAQATDAAQAVETADAVEDMTKAALAAFKADPDESN